MKNLVAMCILLWISSSLMAGVPNWSINPSAYQYQMTISSKVSIACQDLNNSDVIVAAFINGECRGLDSNKVLISGYYYTFMTIYSNVQTGEMVSFKLYDPKTDKVYDVLDSSVFTNNKNIANDNYPYLFMSNYRPESISLSRGLIYKTFPKGTLIGALSTVDRNSNSFIYSMVADSMNNNDYFSIRGDSLSLNKDLIADPISSLKVKIRTDDKDGCTYDSLYTFNILNNDPPPTGLVATDSNIDEHVALNSLAKKLIAIDASPMDEFTYELVPGVGSEGNAKFRIVGDELLVNSDIEYDSATSYSVRIKITDIAQNTLELNATIIIDETINSSQPLKANNLVTPNMDNINDVFEVHNIHLYDEFQLTIYDDNGYKTNEYNSSYSPTEAYNNTWEGIGDNGSKLNTGLYYYYFTDKNGQNVYKGSIYLVQVK